jgi:UDP-N-acetylglucosamine:LPS N-acetylglucosamine transferase
MKSLSLMNANPILICCAPGGHLNAARAIARGLEDRVVYFVVHDLHADTIDGRPVIKVVNCNRGLLNFVQLFQAIKIFLKVRPKVVLSTGSSIAVNFILLARVMGRPAIYVESPTRVTHLSMAARLVYPFVSEMYVRYPSLVKRFPKAKYISPMTRKSYQ